MPEQSVAVAEKEQPVTVGEVRACLVRVDALMEHEQTDPGDHEMWSTLQDCQLVSWARVLLELVEQSVGETDTFETTGLERKILIVAMAMLRTAITRGPRAPGREIYNALNGRLDELCIPRDWPPFPLGDVERVLRSMLIPSRD